MKNKTNLKTINWSILIIVVLTAVITAIITIYDLYNTPAFGEDCTVSCGIPMGDTPYYYLDSHTVHFRFFSNWLETFIPV